MLSGGIAMIIILMMLDYLAYTSELTLKSIFSTRGRSERLLKSNSYRIIKTVDNMHGYY